jgi:hypothetical protein
MENGDKFFVRDSQTVQNRSGKTNDTGSGLITGGTGKFGGMRGLVLQNGSFDIKSGVVEGQYDIEYWLTSNPSWTTAQSPHGRSVMWGPEELGSS